MVVISRVKIMVKLVEELICRISFIGSRVMMLKVIVLLESNMLRKLK